MKPSTVIRFLVILPAAWALSGGASSASHGAHDPMMREHAAPVQEPALETTDDLRREIRALRERVSVLEALKPNFTSFMPSFSERFHVMHRAGDVGDWGVAAHEVEEMRRLTDISRHIDRRLGELMLAFMDGNLRKLAAAIEHGNPKSFQGALRDTVAGCNGCHAATGSTIVVSLNVDETLSMRHPHALRRTTAPKRHMH